MYSYGPPHMVVQKQDDQLELTYSNYVRTQDVTLKTCRRRWMIGRSGERGSGISVLAIRHDDDDIYILTRTCVCMFVCVWESFKHPCIYIYIYSSSSSSCHAASTNFPDSLSPLVSIIPRSRQVFQATSCIGSDLL